MRNLVNARLRRGRIEPIGLIGLQGLVQGTDGNFYGTTFSGGIYTATYTGEPLNQGAVGAGTFFKITPAGVETVLYSFPTSITSNPGAGIGAGGLIQGTDGNFYGTTAVGGTNGSGTIFKITPAGVETVLYSFPARVNPEDTIGPNGFIQGTDGSFYGTTQSGGTNGDGTVFKYTP